MKAYGAISNSARAVWSITPDFGQVETIDAKKLASEVRQKRIKSKDTTTQPVENDDDPEDDGVSEPDEAKPWRARLADILQSMQTVQRIGRFGFNP